MNRQERLGQRRRLAHVIIFELDVDGFPRNVAQVDEKQEAKHHTDNGAPLCQVTTLSLRICRLAVDTLSFSYAMVALEAADAASDASVNDDLEQAEGCAANIGSPP